MEKIKGTGIAMITPFTKDHSVDYKSLEKLIKYQIEGGIDYIVLMGTTGESSVLSHNEKKEIIHFCVKKINKKIPIVLGIGGNNTFQLVEEIKNTDFSGIDAILSVSPCYNKPTQEGIYQHYKIISEASPLPIILYNVPGRTSSNISDQTTFRLAKDFRNIIAIKEASGNFNQIMNIINNKPNDFIVISGDDAITLPLIYMGADGVISVIAQSHPKEYSNMIKLAREGKIKDANEIHYKIYPMYEPIYIEGNPVGIKACLELLGLCKSEVRLPLIKASENIKNQLKKLLTK